jgi:quercetin dioxygenase-like cupin family protein
VITGVAADGRSTIAYEDVSPHLRVAAPGVRYTELWTTPSAPPAPGRHDDAADVPLTLLPGAGGTLIRVCEMHPAESGSESYAMHATPTVDYVVVISGSLRCSFEDGSSTVLGPGDLLVQRGTPHAWAALGDVPCVFLAVIVDAAPVA